MFATKTRRREERPMNLDRINSLKATGRMKSLFSRYLIPDAGLPITVFCSLPSLVCCLLPFGRSCLQSTVCCFHYSASLLLYFIIQDSNLSRVAKPCAPATGGTVVPVCLFSQSEFSSRPLPLKSGLRPYTSFRMTSAPCCKSFSASVTPRLSASA